MKKINLIFKKEIKATIRDKKALLTILLPILIYPVLLILFFGFTQITQSSFEEATSLVAVFEDTPEDFVARLQQDPKIDLFIITQETTDEQLKQQNINAKLTFDEGHNAYIVSYYSTNDSSNQALNRIQRNFRQYQEDYKDGILKEADILDEFESIVSIHEEEISGDIGGRIVAMVLGLILPLIIVLYGVVGTYTISSDLSAGEKERETLETIFSVPIKRFEIIIGKLLACVTVGLLSGLVNILAMFPLVYAVSSSIPDLSISISFSLFIYLFIMLIPIMILTSAAFIGLGMFSKTYQESQSYGSILFIVFMALSYIPLIPNIELTPVTVLIPITNAMLLMKEAFLGSYSLINTFMALGINLGISLIAVVGMNKLFQSDWVIFGGGN